MKCKDSSVELLIICYCFFKGINELAEGLGPAYLLSRTKKEAADDEAKEKFKVLIKFTLRFKIPAYARMTDWLEEMTML